MERLSRELIKYAQGHRERYEWASTDVSGSSAVLDAACGIGYGSSILLKAKPGATYVGIDKADVFHDDFAGARRSFWQRDLDADFLPVITDRYDVVCSFETIEHLQDPKRFVEWLTVVASPSGVIWASVPVVPTVGVNDFHLHDFESGDLESMFNHHGWAMSDSYYQPDELSEVGRFVFA